MSTDSISTELRLQELDDILGRDTDLTQFEILIFQLNSKDENDRSRAESLFSLAKSSRLDSLLLALSRLLSSSLPDLQAKAALHISGIVRSFSLSFSSPFSSICLNEPETTLYTLKSALLSAFENVLLNNVSITHNPYDYELFQAISHFHAINNVSSTHEQFTLYVNNLFQAISNFQATGHWPELLPFLLECMKEGTLLQEKTLLAFRSLAQNRKGETALIPHSNTFLEIFLECLGNSPSNDVKIAALGTLISFVLFVPSWNDPSTFDYLLPLMMKTLTEALNSGSESMTVDSLQLLIILAWARPMVYERRLKKVLRLMLKITVDDSLEVGIRHLAIEFLMTLVRSAPSMISKEPQFIKRLFDELMYILFDIEVVDERHAALIAIPEIALGCKKVMLENLEEVVPKVLESVKDSHHCVRLAAINAINQLCERFWPEFLDQYHEIVIITLVEIFNDSSIPELQVRAPVSI
ncbi:hypothetical protein CRYUN_Cryun16bG0035500 [Craigia yunnanensis]